MSETATLSNRKTRVPFYITLPAILIFGAVLQASFILILVGTLPTITAYYADTTKNRLGLYTVACCNLSGVLPYLLEFHMMDYGLSQVSGYLSSTNMWLSMYGMAAVGYGLIKFCPLMCQTMLIAANKSKIYNLEAKQNALVSRWGKSITETDDLSEKAQENDEQEE